MKEYYVMFNVGRAKYVVNYHDGVHMFKDGSPFFDIRIFSNKKEFRKFTASLDASGYKSIY